MGWGVQLPALPGTAAGSVQRDPAVPQPGPRFGEPQLCFVGSPAQPMLQESLGGVRPPCSSDLLLLSSSHSLSERGKHKELSPPVHSGAVSALTGASADVLLILVWHSSLAGQGG